MTYRIEPAAPPGLRFMAEIRADIGARMTIDATGDVTRAFTPVTGGMVTGPCLRATIEPGGGDWSTEVAGVFRLDAHYLVRTADGVPIEVRNRGIGHSDAELFSRIARDGSASLDGVYFRTVPSFATDAPHYRWLAERVFLGVGREFGAEIVLHIFEVL